MVGTGLRISPNHDQLSHVRNNMDNAVLRTHTFKSNELKARVGFIAETIVCDLLDQERPLVRKESDTGGDVKINGLNCDVKAVLRHQKSLWSFHGAVADVQQDQDTDAYIFVSVDIPRGNYHIMGWCTKEELQEKGTHLYKGQTMPNDRVKNAPAAPCDCTVIQYSALNRINEVEDLQSIGLKD